MVLWHKREILVPPVPLTAPQICVPWIIDSSASDRMTNLSSLFKTYSLCSRDEKIIIADGSFSSIAGKGRITLSKHID